jgi:hypothetical protein
MILHCFDGEDTYQSKASMSINQGEQRKERGQAMRVKGEGDDTGKEPGGLEGWKK